MCVAQRVLADLQRPQEHLLALLGLVRLQLLVCEAVVDCDGEGVVGAQVVA